MNGWPAVQLGEVADLCLGKMLDAKKNKGDPYPYLSNPDVRWFDVDTSRLKNMLFESRELDRFGLCAGDVLVCEGGEAGRAAVWDGRRSDVKFQKAIHRVRPRPRLLNRFLVHKLFADYHAGRLEDYYTGATIKHLTGQDLATYELALPPIEEQRRIAEVLDRAEALRAKRRAALALLDTLAQSVFLDLFGDVEDRGWPVVTVADMAADISGSIRTGPFGSQLLHEEFVEEGIAVLGIDNVVQNEFLWGRPRFITEEKYLDLRRYTVRPRDVLITIMGTCGRCAIVPPDIRVAINTKHLCCITLDPHKCLPEFLHACFLRHPMARRYLAMKAKGAIMEGLNMGIIKSMPIPMPPLAVQEVFTRRVAAVEKLKSAHLASLAQLDALFASLQHRAFRGEL